jgi:hypothetical protein
VLVVGEDMRGSKAMIERGVVLPWPELPALTLTC